VPRLPSHSRAQYDTRGPGQPGLAPRLASERLTQFRTEFEDKNRMYEAFAMGERLFGLPTTDYPDLEVLRRELKMLERLYGLYNDVINTIASYDDIRWTALDSEKMTTEVTDFQSRQKKMPKSLREWAAFNELTKVIDDFANTLPLLQMLKNDYVIDRHWDKVSELCGTVLDWKNPDFRVKNLLDANLVRFREEIEVRHPPPRLWCSDTSALRRTSAMRPRRSATSTPSSTRSARTGRRRCLASRPSRSAASSRCRAT
jgi:dynein heavy chain